MKSAAWWFMFLLLSAPAPEAGSETANKGEDRQRSAVQTRCLQECSWLSSVPARYDREKIKKLEQNCVEAERVNKALATEAPAGWGESKEQAIEVCLPEGERAFLDDLRCKDGRPPSYHRSGNVGPRNLYPEGANIDIEKLMDFAAELKPGETDLHIVDRYEVKCSDEAKALFFDMYHCGTPKPWRAPAGFTRPLR